MMEEYSNKRICRAPRKAKTVLFGQPAMADKAVLS